MNINNSKLYVLFLILFQINISCISNSSTEIEENGHTIITEKNIFSDIEKKSFYYKTNILYRIEECNLNNQTNNISTYYDSGKLETKYSVKSDLIDGYFYAFFDNNKNSMKVKTKFLEGREIGVRVEYYENGRISSIINFFNEYKLVKSYENNKQNSLFCVHKIKFE